MKKTPLLTAIGIAIAAMLGAGPAAAGPAGFRATIQTYVHGLNSPRGLAFGPDGALYIAEAGDGSESTSTAGECTQVKPPVGPYVGGYTGRVSRLDHRRQRQHCRRRARLRHTLHAEAKAIGLAAVAFAGNQYARFERGRRMPARRRRSDLAKKSSKSPPGEADGTLSAT